MVAFHMDMAGLPDDGSPILIPMWLQALEGESPGLSMLSQVGPRREDSLLEGGEKTCPCDSREE